MADFDTWKFDSLVQFAKESQARIAELEARVQEMTLERADFVAAIRKLVTQEHDK